MLVLNFRLQFLLMNRIYLDGLPKNKTFEVHQISQHPSCSIIIRTYRVEEAEPLISKSNLTLLDNV